MHNHSILRMPQQSESLPARTNNVPRTLSDRQSVYGDRLIHQTEESAPCCGGDCAYNRRTRNCYWWTIILNMKSWIVDLVKPNLPETITCVSPLPATIYSDQEDLKAESAWSMRLSINLYDSRLFSNTVWLNKSITKSGKGQANDLAFLGRPVSLELHSWPSSAHLNCPRSFNNSCATVLNCANSWATSTATAACELCSVPFASYRRAWRRLSPSRNEEKMQEKGNRRCTSQQQTLCTRIRISNNITTWRNHELYLTSPSGKCISTLYTWSTCQWLRPSRLSWACQETDESKSNVQCGETFGKDEIDMHAKVGYRIQCIPHAAVEQEDDARKELISKLVHQIKNHPNKDALIADLQQDHPYNPFSEKSEEMIHDLGNVENLEMCEISLKVQCIHRLKYWTTGILYSTCGTCMIPTEHTRRLNRRTFDALSMPYFVIKKGPPHGARHVNTKAQREYLQAHQCLKKAKKKKYDTTLQRLQQSDTYRESHLTIGWDG